MIHLDRPVHICRVLGCKRRTRWQKPISSQGKQFGPVCARCYGQWYGIGIVYG